MRRQRLLRQLFPAFLFSTLAALLGFELYAMIAWERSLDVSARETLDRQARLAASRTADAFDAPLDDAHRARLMELALLLGGRLTLIDLDGAVRFDTSADASQMENHASRPEVAEALRGRNGLDRRPSHTTREVTLYLAQPVRRDEELVGVVRTALPLGDVNRAIASMRMRMLGGVLAAALIAALASWWLAARVVRPVDEMRRGAERFAGGDLGYKLPVPASEELGALARALNQMAADLQTRIETIAGQKNEQAAVLESMSEAVLAVDAEQRILRLNKAAADLLGCSAEDALGQKLCDLVRNMQLKQFVAEALAASDVTSAEIEWSVAPARVFQAQGALLHDARQSVAGAVIVLNDMTRIRRLENIRRDFVANVSHELKTPIASIQGFVETLIDGARNDPQDCERFLKIIAHQAERLNSIIDDLLNLSRIEETERKGDIQLQRGKVGSLLRTAIEQCRPLAESKQIELKLACDDRLEASMNPLLERAVVNLLENAIKYSDPAKSVSVAAAETRDSVTIVVEDRGWGIEPQHLERLFERFYRVDKARSRKLGGTGLGLAIVKHIVQLHGGHVTVRSTPGQGSQFTIHLGRAAPSPPANSSPQVASVSRP